MAQQTQHVVQPFVAGKGGVLRAERAVACKTSDEAVRRARNMAASKLGVVAFTMSGDAETGDYDDRPTVLFKAGHVPPEFED